MALPNDVSAGEVLDLILTREMELERLRLRRPLSADESDELAYLRHASTAIVDYAGRISSKGKRQR